MELSAAESEVRRAIARSSQNVVAERIGVQASLLSRWLNGHSEPEGKGRERIITWAEQQAKRSAALVADPVGLDEEVPIAEIRGYARAVARMLESALDEQRRVIDALGVYASRPDTGAPAAPEAEVSRLELRAKRDAAVLREVAEAEAEKEKAPSRVRRRPG